MGEVQKRLRIFLERPECITPVPCQQEEDKRAENEAIFSRYFIMDINQIGFM